MRNSNLDFFYELNDPSALRLHNSADYQIDVITDLEAIQHLGPTWRALEHKSASPHVYFQTHDWCAAWVDKFGGQDSDQRTVHTNIVTASFRGEIVLIWPLMIEQRPMGLSSLTSLSMPHAQYSNVLVAPASGERRLFTGLGNISKAYPA